VVDVVVVVVLVVDDGVELELLVVDELEVVVLCPAPLEPVDVVEPV
jgi:hypothetical protein